MAAEPAVAKPSKKGQSNRLARVMEVAEVVRQDSAQPRDVVGHSLDFAVIQPASNGHHLHIVALAGTKRQELSLGVVTMLAPDTRVLHGQASARGAVATGAGWNLALQDATTVDLFAQGHGVLALGKTGLGLFAAIKRCNMLHVVITERAHHAHHDRVLALARLELLQLLDDVFRVLALQDRVGRAATRAIGGMASHARGRQCLAFGGVGLDGVGLGGEHRTGAGRGQYGKNGEGCWQFHAKGLFGERAGLQAGLRDIGRVNLALRCWRLKNPLILQCLMTVPESPRRIVPVDPAKAALAWTHGARFLTTASQLDQLPQEELPEIAFVGRSNAGKSTAINTLAQQKRLAFASRTPGRTQHINLFAVGPKDAPNAYFADLPGYGYAAVERAAKLRWQEVMADYLRSRHALAGIVMMVDSRHGFTPLDLQLLEFVAPRVTNGEVKLLVLLTKSDKLNRSEAQQSLRAAQKVLADLATDSTDIAVALFSALSRHGLADAAVTLRAWIPKLVA